MIRQAFISLLIVLSSSFQLKAQEVKCLWVQTDKSQTDVYPNSDIQATLNRLKEILPNLQSQGYMCASIDTFYISNDTLKIHVYKGNQYKLALLKTDELPLDLKAQFNQIIKKSPYLKPHTIATLAQKALAYGENLGYPFAQFQLQNISLLNNDTLSASVHFDLGQLVRIDSIIVHGSSKINKNLLLKLTDLEEGMILNPKRLHKISERINALPYLQEEQKWRLYLNIYKNKLNLYLKEKKANQANAILGIQPQASNPNKYYLTADILLKFKNIMGYGEDFGFTFQQLPEGSRKYNLGLGIPYFLGTDFGIESSFNFFQIDTTFRKTDGTIGINYFISPSDKVSLYYQIQSNRVITFDTQFVKTNNALPANIDFSNNGVGFIINWNQLDNPLNPSKGYYFNIDLYASRRKIIENQAIDIISRTSGYDFNQLYDKLSPNSIQSKFSGAAKVFIPLLKWSSLMIRYDGAFITGKTLFRNEMYTIGGHQLLRGFDERSIFASQYHIATIEPRLRLTSTSYVSLFSDLGFIDELDLEKNRQQQFVWSAGIGSALNTANGLFNIAIALGQRENSEFKLKNARIHFGYAVYF